jgi:2-polyprenyl-3-methyl-5-hydroxy-6-metoxy-1,4-benzoquinol methylase
MYKGPVLENYVKIKLVLDNYYKIYHSLIPLSAKITDIGCGFGFMSYTLSLCSQQREIVAIDYDDNKIITARNCALAKQCNIHFESADAINYTYKPSDVFIISDMLHYLTRSDQEYLLNQCIKMLNEKGKIIIRDSDVSLKKRHIGTQLSEYLSTHIGFNKTKNKLCFISREFIEGIASANKLNIRILDRTKYTSNLIYMLEKKVL